MALLLVGAFALPAPANAASRRAPRGRGAAVKARAAEHAREASLVVSTSKVAILPFRGDDTDQIRAQIIKVLRPKVRELSTNLRAPDTTEQYRDMGAALNLALYVQGHVKDVGRDQSVLTIDLRSAVSGRKISSVTFAGSRRKLYADAEDELWPRIEKPFSRACLDASKAVRHHNAPMRIEAGSPIADSPRSSL